MAVVSSWHLKRDLAKIPNVSFPPGTRRTVAPAMLRACRHNRGGVAVLPGGCLPYLPLLKPGGKRGQLSTSVGLSGWPPEVFKFEGGWAGIVGGGCWVHLHGGMEQRAQGTRGCFLQSCCHTNRATARLQRALKISEG